MASLSSADRLQAKVATVTNDPVTVSLDNPCTEGSNVLIEVTLGGLPITDGGLQAHVPDGFSLDFRDSSLFHYVFRKPQVAAGEQSWQFSSGISTEWLWRVSEWGPNLDPVSPLDASAGSGTTTGSGTISKSTGTTLQNGRNGVVALAWHFASLPAPATSGSWGSHTNSFTQAHSFSQTMAAARWVSSWSEKYADVGTFETTADLTASPRNASDILTAMVVVYTATTYVDPPVV